MCAQPEDLELGAADGHYAVEHKTDVKFMTEPALLSLIDGQL
jgi:hypothetical protein